MSMMGCGVCVRACVCVCVGGGGGGGGGCSFVFVGMATGSKVAYCGVKSDVQLAEG